MNVNKKTEKVRFFEAHCRDCNKTLGVPLLSDFAYGEFILKSEDGKVFAYLNGIVEKNFDLISKTLKELGEDRKHREMRIGKYGFLSTLWANIKPKREEDYYLPGSYLDRLQWTIAHCADEIGGQRLTTHFVCPNCQSKNVLYGDAVVVKDDEIPIVTFDTCNALSESEKKERVREIYNISKGLF